MIFEKKLTPDTMLDAYFYVTPSLCREMGICAIISDIDNTLATYSDSEMPDGVEKWLDSLRRAGIKIAFISNNSKDRVKTFVGDADFSIYPDAHKPSAKCFLAAARDFGLPAEKIAVLGDQLLTDCFGGKNAGMKVIIVPPIKDRTGLFFKLKRWVERPYIRKYLKGHIGQISDGNIWS